MTIQEKARQALIARDTLDIRWVDLVMQLAIRLGISPDEVERRIVELAS